MSTRTHSIGIARGVFLFASTVAIALFPFAAQADHQHSSSTYYTPTYNNIPTYYSTYPPASSYNSYYDDDRYDDYRYEDDDYYDDDRYDRSDDVYEYKYYRSNDRYNDRYRDDRWRDRYDRYSDYDRYSEYDDRYSSGNDFRIDAQQGGIFYITIPTDTSGDYGWDPTYDRNRVRLERVVHNSSIQQSSYNMNGNDSFRFYALRRGVTDIVFRRYRGRGSRIGEERVYRVHVR